MRRELGELLSSGRGGELDPNDFAVRLESLHARFLGDAADSPEMAKGRQHAVKAYKHLIAGTDVDRHHHIELLAEALDPDLPDSPRHT